MSVKINVTRLNLQWIQIISIGITTGKNKLLPLWNTSRLSDKEPLYTKKKKIYKISYILYIYIYSHIYRVYICVCVCKKSTSIIFTNYK